eukprot:TRINITY_DN31677_c0_g1_i1.p2 TRINITY_DN31677_c0_g1~~TRINITY_DN31677_c0_g1_i1.p2  ORF type:complete len:109 (-),score=15.79 TRINITY_DN31677_c0_g1_i1:670-996(-)
MEQLVLLALMDYILKTEDAFQIVEMDILSLEVIVLLAQLMTVKNVINQSINATYVKTILYSSTILVSQNAQLDSMKDQTDTASHVYSTVKSVLMEKLVLTASDLTSYL